ncbi:hypothetical protein MHB84_09260 [Paenibacillus sp. FSL F4-0087]|uniref:Uncharacterized protein n=1 Tax=Paenibacillus taichungensis TaxID=484184 RepID=A0ABX2MHE8_9BACL|nr:MULTISPECIES: hypothetical protein [Paenibacillus]MDR9749380.1 hypothetical protein [Paenibacillus taichungensis]NUU53219.1 hypothetical protein [Paenibacillus taichungensis]OME77523.1 hypothetical protein BK122_26185 [Paenibacillus pabuli]PIH55940.1 hypothetical protein CS562_28585 [Paenibacillus sp. LK1]
MDQQTEQLTRKLLLNSNSRGVTDEVVPMDETLEDAEYAEEYSQGTFQSGSFWGNSNSAHEHEWQGRVETHEMFRRSYE